MCITIINSSNTCSARASKVEGEVDARTGTSRNTSRALPRLPIRRRTRTQPSFSERSLRRVRLICSSQASDSPSSIQGDREGSNVSESSTSTDSAKSLAKKRCQPRPEERGTQHPLAPDQASEPGTEYVSSLSDKSSSLRTSRRGNDGHYLSLHSQTFRLLDFDDDDSDSDDEDFHM